MEATYVYLLAPQDVEWINSWNADLERANVVVEYNHNKFYTIARGLEENLEAFGEVLQYFTSRGITKKLFEVA